MLLKSVTYQVFEHERSGPWPTNRTSWHQIDGQVVLNFFNGQSLFISWGNGIVQYCIEQREQSFFSPDTLVEVPMTDHPYWLQFAGKNIGLTYLDQEQQVLTVTNAKNNLFISSQYDDGTFRGDCVRISQLSPL
jgi:hypothetical protein